MGADYEGDCESLPVWERGLKDRSWPSAYPCHDIAPRVGAWIESGPETQRPVGILIAPRVGAWIERVVQETKGGLSRTSLPVRERGLKEEERRGYRVAQDIAPRAGAWIERGVQALGRRHLYYRSPCGSVD